MVELLFEKIKALPSDHKKKLEQALWECGIEKDGDIGTAQLLDHRTIDIIKNYLAFQKDPMRPFNDDPPKIWFESVIDLQNIFQQRLW